MAVGKYNFKDVMLNDSGDITIQNGDIKLCGGIDCFTQHIKIRALTNSGEIPMHPTIGANLDELEGMPNTRNTGEIAMAQLLTSLSAESKIPIEAITVRPVPTGSNEITLYVCATIQHASGITKSIIDVKTVL
jgi:phage baseplate assembly protein W